MVITQREFAKALSEINVAFEALEARIKKLEAKPAPKKVTKSA